ncbi:hypothetical protein [Paenibacillus cremeus]|uniref:Alginate lyase domain-containing protein n=1 Tax=Paenibacillus cremeus TaxID=2163881 RepID=A0A559K6M5_9BACL|nr:hypothetical protein [Paenibacillus cremeus]TVY07766.1 hypothetical protein FPZ49_22360 [Paenibacillus cremeus]
MHSEISLVEKQEQRWRRLEPQIVADPASYWFGSTDITVTNVTELLATAVPLYCHSQSRYYRDSDMLQRIIAATKQLHRRQLASGCISLMNCNIDSPPDTAFAVHLIGIAYQVLVKSGFSEAKEAEQLLRQFLENTKPCLLTGGIHTPNHRWVMCRALALLYEIFPEDALRDRAYQYLNEGFDLTEYGEWTERSNAVYNPHCDLALYHVYRVFGHEPSLEAGCRNLNMMLYLLHADHTIVTEYSSRQDRGSQEFMGGEYEIAYRLLAAETNNAQFASMAKLAAKSNKRPTLELMYWLLYPEKMAWADQHDAPLPTEYTKLFDSGRRVRVPKEGGNREGFGPMHGAAVLRHRNGPLSVTAMAGQQDWLHVQYGEAKLIAFRLVIGYFGLGGVSFPTIQQVDERTYRLHVDLLWGYQGPLEQEIAAPYGGYFSDMPNHLRELTHAVRLPVTVELSLQDNAIEMAVVAEEVPQLIAQLVAAFDDAGELEGEGIVQPKSSLYQLRQGAAVYRKGTDWIRISEGAHEHTYEVIRGDNMDFGRKNVTINLVGPVRRQVTMEYGRTSAE